VTKKFKTKRSNMATIRLAVLQLSYFWNSDDRLDVYLLFVIAE